jgi:hypothetical protein|tara:strand:+ start:123 stop:530 length:408 start_codon:yes stop_codon:yes gene_type:complete
MTAFDKAWDVVKEVEYTEGGMHSCPQCEGRREIQVTENNADGTPKKINAVTCPSCNGTGQMTSEALISQRESDDDWCSCPEYNGMAHDRFGGQVPASPEQIQDWKDGVTLVEDEDEEGPYSYTVCSTCNGMVSAG